MHAGSRRRPTDGMSVAPSWLPVRKQIVSLSEEEASVDVLSLCELAVCRR